MTWTLHPSGQFDAFAGRWQELNQENGNSPLLASEFVRPLLSEFGTGRELLACHEQGGAITAMAIVVPRRAGIWETFQPSQEPVSLWVNARGLDVTALAASLLRALPGFPLILGLPQRDPMLAARPGDGGAVRTLDYIETAKISIEGSFDDYWSARGKNLRSNLRKQRSKLAHEGIVPRMEILREPSQMAQAIVNYGMLESAGWKAKTGTAVHHENAQGRFYRKMLEGFCARGAGSVYQYWFNEELVAMNLCIEGDGSLIVLKTSYKEELSGHYSPAFLMREDTLRRLFEERRFARLEFYGKVMEWHRRWTEESRRMYHLNNYRWPALVHLHHLADKRKALVQRLKAPFQPVPTPTTPSAE
jgi:CelD/BcsL family acetyltransferase involved in cellulose biosynthesis